MSNDHSALKMKIVTISVFILFEVGVLIICVLTMDRNSKWADVSLCKRIECIIKGFKR